MVKRVFAVLCTVIVVALSIVPCFADTWAEKNPTYSQYLRLPYLDGFAENLADNVASMVDRAYEIGLFGGAKPLVIMYNYTGNGTGFYIEVVTPTFSTTISSVNKNQIRVNRFSSNSFALTGNGQYRGTAIWRLTSNGDWVIAGYGAVNSGYIELSDAVQGYEPSNTRKIVRFTGNGSSVWQKGTEFWEVEYCAGLNPDIVVLAQTVPNIESIYQEQIDLLSNNNYDQGYEDGYRQGFANGSPNLLNIPSIFDSMFDGVRSIMTAFDVELFGISIIGTLVAVLVIAIIAFVVRKLWK